MQQAVSTITRMYFASVRRLHETPLTLFWRLSHRGTFGLLDTKPAKADGVKHDTNINSKHNSAHQRGHHTEIIHSQF